MRNPKSTRPLTIPEQAVECVRLCETAEGANRAQASDDLQFSHGDQWPQQIKMQRMLDHRPCLTINKTDTFERSVINTMRQQRPRIKVDPVDSGADQQIAEVIEGLIRHIEVTSDADIAYMTAADYQVRMGWGFWRINARYVDEASFDQELEILPIKSPFSVYFDPSSTSPAGMDAKWVVITDRIRRDEFRRLYPKAKEADFTTTGTGDSLSFYSTSEEITIAEYWRIEEVPEKLYQLSNEKSYFESEIGGPKKIGDMVDGGVVVRVRDSIRRQVKWSKVTKTQVLDERDWPGKYIPVVRVVGTEMIEGGKRHFYGMTRHLRDPQMAYNFWRTQETEFVALAPKAPWLVAEGHTENHENEWSTANVKNHATLTYKPVQFEDGTPVPPPERLQPQPIPAASVQAAMGASEDLKAVAGMFDPALGAPGNETSGEMVARRQAQSDLSNFHFYDNLTIGIKATGLMLLDLIPKYYSEQRMIRIIGVDGKPDKVMINQMAVDKVKNDLSVGRYDVVMDTGPGYETKRQEAAAMMVDLMRAMPQVGQVAGDIVISQMDWPGAELIAERLEMANPLAMAQKQIPEDLPPEAKKYIAQLMGQLQHAQQMAQQLMMEKQAKVFGVQVKEQAVTQREMALSNEKEIAETHRTHIKEDAETHRTHMEIAGRLQETAMKDSTSLHETVIDANTNLEIAHKQALNRGDPHTNRPSA
jgi:hypothetical protein